MGKSELCSRFVGCALLLIFFIARAASSSSVPLALTPPRGWNSYDSFSWVITEEEFLANAEYVAANLLQHGYEYVVVDFLWYRKHVDGASPGTSGFEIIDEWGRLVPDIVRWPSTAGGKGFKPIADKVHAMGLKFGIHIMRGISTAAVEQDTPIFGAKGSPDGTGGKNWTATDIAIKGGECSWMKNCFIRVDHRTEGGRAFVTSLFQQYSEWGVDFIKNDCVFGVFDLDEDEITAVGKAIADFGRPMVYSLSPGVFATPELGSKVAHLSHMYRITMDDWDRWSDILSHFSVARDFAAAGLIGAPGLAGGKSWPDMDMLPIGWLTDPDANYGPHRLTSLSHDEQRTQFTLWAMAKSPLMFGGDLRHIDDWTLDLITQPTVLELNINSTHNKELDSSVRITEPTISLEDCALPNTAGWELKSFKAGQDVLCWTAPPKVADPKENCLNWRDSLAKDPLSDESRSGQLWSPVATKDCLESSFYNEKAGDLSYSKCNGSPSQLWHFSKDGRVRSNKDGLCAAIKEATNGWRIWVARGGEGQGYVGLFNLDDDRTLKISVSVAAIYDHINSQLMGNSKFSRRKFMEVMNRWRVNFWRRTEELYHRLLSTDEGDSDVGDGTLQSKYNWMCTGLDVWANQTFAANMTKLEGVVPRHGVVLYELRCTPGEGVEQGSLLWYFVVSSVLLMTLVATYFFSDFRSWFFYRRRGFSNLNSRQPSGSFEEALPLHKEKNMQEFASL